MNQVVSESLIIGVDFTRGVDTGVLIVGRKKPNQAVDIINAFQGEEARELYERLITVKKSGVSLDE